MTEKPLSSAVEDYLKAIFELGEAKTQALADALEVSPASVTGMLKKLSALGLIEYERYRGVTLTPAGRKIALETLRHHRLIETYLAEALGYPWHEVHDEAERLEHHISEDFEDRIAEVLGNPTHDPHGDPIPGRDGSLPQSLGRPLTELEVGQRGENHPHHQPGPRGARVSCSARPGAGRGGRGARARALRRAGDH